MLPTKITQSLIDNYGEYTTCRQTNYFLSACRSWFNNTDSYHSRSHCTFGCMTGIGNSWVHLFSRNCKFLRLHAILHDSAGFLKTKYNIGPGYCYMFKRVQLNSYLIGHIAGIVYCIFLKFFDPLYTAIDC